jgi:outer membrane protein
MRRFAILLFSSLTLIGRAATGDTNALPFLSLEEAKRIAIQNHPQLAAANYKALAAQEVVTQTRAGFFPTVNLYGNAVGANQEGTRILAGGLNNPSVYDRTAGGVAVHQLITDFGHTGNLTAQSKFQAQAENEQANATREQILLQIDVNYLGALEAQAVLRVAQETFDTRKLLLDQVSVLSSNKLKSDLDVSFAQVALEEGRLLLQKAENNTQATMTSLSTAMGYREPRQFQLQEQPQEVHPVTNDVSQLVETALSSRPELLSLQSQHDAAIHSAKAQRDARLPSLEAVGVAGGAATHDRHLPDSYAVGGIQLSIPLFAGGLYAARQSEAELKAEADEQLLRAAENNVVRDVHLAFLSVNTAQNQWQTTEQLVHHATQAYDLAKARYQIGSSSIVELSQAQLSLTSAEIAETNARFEVLMQQANLDYQVGMLH